MTNQADHGSGQPSWRGSGGDQPRRESGESNSWRKTSGARGSSPLALAGNRRAKKIGQAIAAAFSLALSGSLIVLLWVMPGCTKTELVVATIDSYQDCRLPVPAFTKRDSEALDQTRGRLIGSVSSQVQTAEELTKRLASIDERSVVVVFLSAHGGLLAEGGAGRDQTSGLFFKDSSVDEPQNKPTVRRSFYSLDQLCGELKHLPPQQHKLLLLDVGATQPDWRAGLLGNWFADTLEEQIKGISNLTVICSCAPSERSWGGGNLGENPSGRTAFAHFVSEGLKGAADANRNRRLTFEELFDYVRNQTNAWVWQNRDSSGQHPTLVSLNNKFNNSVYIALSSSSKSSAATPIEPQKSQPKKSAATTGPPRNLTPVWKSLDILWQEREQLRGAQEDLFRSNAAYQFDPLSWRALTQNLLAAEQFQRQRAAEQAEPLVRNAETLLNQLRGSIEHDILRAFEGQPFVSEHVVRRILSKPQSASKETRVTLPEDHFAEACRELLPQYVSAGKQGVELRRLAEQVACGPLGTRLISRKLIAEGDRLRHRAEDQLFLRGEVEQIQKHQADATRVYQQARNLQQTYYQMACLRNRLLAELPELAVWAAFRAPQVGSAQRQAIIAAFQSSLTDTPIRFPAVKQLRQLTESVDGLDRVQFELLILFRLNQEFEKKLKAWATDDAVSDVILKETQAQFEEARQCLKTIDENIAQQVELLSTPQKQPQVAEWRHLDELLAYPELSRKDRVILNGLISRYSEKLQTGVKVADVAKSPAEPAPDLRAAHARWHALWAIQTLSRGVDGINDEEELWEFWNKLPSDDNPDFKRKATELGDRIRRAYIVNRSKLEEESLRGESREAATESYHTPESILQQRITADRAFRNYVDSCTAAEFAVKLNPAANLRRHQMEYLLLSLSEQYLIDYWQGWYDQAVAECLKGASGLGLAGFQERIHQLQAALQQHQSAYPEIVGNTVVFGSTDLKVVPITVGNRGLPPGEAAFWLDVPTAKGLIHRDNIRRPIELSDAANAGTNQSLLNFRLERDGTSEHNLELIEAKPQIFFRGHTWKDRIKAIRINPARPVGIQLTYQAAPRTGKVVVEGYQKPTILFIMDCSLSMTTAVAGGGTRYSIASSVFEETLKNLASQEGNNACNVGLLAYGGELNGVQMLNDIDLLNPEHQQRIVASWKKLKPEGGTPLYQAIEKACDDLQKRNSAGTIVAITDGIDGESDPQAARFETVKRRLERARADGANLIIIGFGIQASDLKTPEEVQKFRQMKTLTSRFYDAQGRRALDEAMREAVRIRPYSIVPASPRDRSLKSANDIPFGTDYELPHGKYQARFDQARPLNFEILGGEFIKLQADQNQIIHPKPTNIRGSEPNPAALQELRFGYRNFKIDHKNGVAEFVFSLTNDDESVSAPRPAEIDFQVNPLDEPGQRSLEWAIEPGQTVPTWHVTVSNWPGNKPAEVQATWKTKRTPPDRSYRWSEFRALREFEITSTANEKVTLKLLTAQFNAKSNSARIEMQLADFDPQSPPVAGSSSLEELRETRFELQQRGSNDTTPDFSFRREFIAEEGKLIVEIDVSETPSLDDWEVLITSRKSLKAGAVQLKTPLRILKTDQEL